MLEEQNFDPDAMMRKARIKARGMQQQVQVGRWGNLIADAYNVMFMAARAALAKQGIQVNTHQTVAAHYRKHIVEKGLVDPKFAEHLNKIKKYWESEQEGQPEQIDQARAIRIAKAALDLVDSLASLGSGDSSRTKMDPKMLHYNE